MPRDTSDIGSNGLEQGGANLGNDYSRPISSDRNEQNTTTNVGSHPSDANKKTEKDSKNNDTTEGGDEGGSMPDPETLSIDEDAGTDL